jgi:hypothetical protein
MVHPTDVNNTHTHHTIFNVDTHMRHQSPDLVQIYLVADWSTSLFIGIYAWRKHASISMNVVH